MRKFSFVARHGGLIYGLQCGRIYKDAEIPRLLLSLAPSRCLLQCGRIYKDAEIYVLILSE